MAGTRPVEAELRVGRADFKHPNQRLGAPVVQIVDQARTGVDAHRVLQPFDAARHEQIDDKVLVLQRVPPVIDHGAPLVEVDVAPAAVLARIGLDGRAPCSTPSP